MALHSNFDQTRAWDRAGSHYQAQRDPSWQTVTYGALAPSEADIRLLGDLRGRHVLDLGCGGGQNALACARAGANVTALDSSEVQLAYGRALADQHGLPVTWLHADAALAGQLLSPGFDLILAVHSLAYVQDIAATLAACRHLLRAAGRLVISLDHPLRDCFLDETDGDLSGFPIRDYFDPAPVAWRFAPDLPMQTHHRPLSEWFSLLRQAQLRIDTLLEPPLPPGLCDKLWPLDSPLAPLRAIPHTLIFIAIPDET